MLKKHFLKSKLFYKSSGQMMHGVSVFCVIIATGLVTGLCVNFHKLEDFLNAYKR